MVWLQKIKQKFVELQVHMKEVCTQVKSVSQNEAQSFQEQVDKIATMLPLIHLEINGWEKLNSSEHNQASKFFYKMLDSDGRTQQTTISAYMGLGLYHSLNDGYGAEETHSVYSKLYSLSKQMKLVIAYFSSLRGLWSYNIMNLQFSKALDISKEMLKIASHIKHPTLLIESYVAKAFIKYFTASWDEMKSDQKKIFEICKENGETGDLFLEHPVLLTLGISSLSNVYQNSPDKALKKINYAYAVLQKIQNISPNKRSYNITLILFFTIRIYQIREEVSKTVEFAEQMRDIARENKFLLWQSIAEIFLGWGFVQQNKETGLQLIENAFVTLDNFEIDLHRPMLCSLLAESYRKLGHHEKAYKAIQKAQSFLSEKENNVFIPEILNIKGKILMDDPERQHEAADCLRRSYEFANQNNMHFVTFPPLLNLASHTTGSESDYYKREIKNIYANFNEGFSTSSLIKARTLVGY